MTSDSGLQPSITPLLRWAGSKRRLLPDLLRAVPPTFRRYVEPFAGSACLFFALQPRRALLGDINGDLLDTYATICKSPRAVARAAHGIPCTPRAYYRLRAQNPSDLVAVHRAARFVYLNRHCFNGVYRVNRAGAFNVPRGVRTGRLPPEEVFVQSALALRRAQLKVGDFRDVLGRVREGDFVYLDPPYASGPRPTYGEYSYDSFSDADIPDLNAWLLRLHTIGAVFVLSYAYGRHACLAQEQWFVRRVRTARHVAGFSRHRRGVYEALVSNRPLR